MKRATAPNGLRRRVRAAQSRAATTASRTPIASSATRKTWDTRPRTYSSSDMRPKLAPPAARYKVRHPCDYIQITNRPCHESCQARQTVLAREIRARLLLLRRPPAERRTDDLLGRRPELPGAQLHARRDEARRPRLLLPFGSGAAVHRRGGRGGAGGLSRPHRLRPEAGALRPEVEGGGADVDHGGPPRRGAAVTPALARRPARRARPRADGAPPEGEPVERPAGVRRGVGDRVRARQPPMTRRFARQYISASDGDVPADVKAIPGRTWT